MTIKRIKNTFCANDDFILKHIDTIGESFADYLFFHDTDYHFDRSHFDVIHSHG